MISRKVKSFQITKVYWLYGIVSIICLTLFTMPFYIIYLFKRKDDLDRLVLSLKDMEHINGIENKQINSSFLPQHLTELIQNYLNENLTQYLIISCVTGLGNRLQSIVSAFLMGMMMHRRLVIHWPKTGLHSCPFDQLFEPQSASSWNLFNRYTKDYILSNSQFIDFHGPFDELLCHTNLKQFKQQTQFLFLSTDEYFMSVLMKNPHYSQTLFNNINEDDLFRSIVNYLFVPIKELQHRIEKYSLKIGQCDRGLQMRKWGVKPIETNGEQLFLSKFIPIIKGQ